MSFPITSDPASAASQDSEIDLDIDIDQYIDESDAPEPTADAGRSRSSAPAARRGRDGNRALIRRVLAKADEVRGATPADRKLLAHLLSTQDAVSDITVAVMTAERGSFGAVSDLREVADADVMEAALVAMALGRPRMKAVWSLLENLDLAKGTLSPLDVKAAVVLATAAKKLGLAERARLDRIVALGKR